MFENKIRNRKILTSGGLKEIVRQWLDKPFQPIQAIRPKVDASIFDSALSHTRRSDASEKREEKSVSTFGRFRLWTSFESSPVSVKAPVIYL